ncbi:MAG: hypothetical protein KAS04_00695 [Candidatus Aenigmarchaeota archaeon]|nr:hypothetical protein [Candidatus Aenigmarchaeota archaeon]
MPFKERRLKSEAYKGFEIKFRKVTPPSGMPYVIGTVSDKGVAIREQGTNKTETFNILKREINKHITVPQRVKTRFDILIDDALTYDDEWDLDMQVKAARGEIRDTKAPAKEKKTALAKLNKEYKEHKEGFDYE